MEQEARRRFQLIDVEFREVIILREMEKLSYAKIAEMAQIPTGTVMSRLSRARRRLRETLVSRPQEEA